MDYPAEFVEQLVGLSRSLAGNADIALQRVADLAVEQLNGCDMAGVTLVRDGEPSTTVFTDDEAPEIDRAQYETGQGPCLDAFRNGVILRIDETMDDDRWTEFASTAFSHGVRSTLSLPLRGEDETIGALNLYSRSPHAFTDNEQMATVFVAHAAAALASAQAYSAAQALNEQLRTALASRAVIEQAKGVLMRDHECDAEGAFEMLKHASQHTNRKVRDVAVEVVVEVGERVATLVEPLLEVVGHAPEPSTAVLLFESTRAVETANRSKWPYGSTGGGAGDRGCTLVGVSVISSTPASTSR